MTQSAMTKREEFHSGNCLQGVPYRDLCWMFPLGLSYSTDGYEFNISESKSILNKVPLNRNTHKMRLCTD